jgi:Uma2 family endonuclease
MATDVTTRASDSSPELEEDEDVIAGLDRFRDWAHSDLYPEHGKFSYIQGVLEGEMSPESHHEHNSIKSRLTAWLCKTIDELQLGEVFSDRSMLVNEAVGLATEPDLMFCKWETLQTECAKLQPYKNSAKGLVELHGTPDLVVEIVSPSSVKKDKVRLKKAYFECGIPEYWLIDARGAKLDFKIFVRGQNQYKAVEAAADEYLPSPLFDVAVRLERTPHPLVGFQYRLLTRDKGQA